MYTLLSALSRSKCFQSSCTRHFLAKKNPEDTGKYGKPTLDSSVITMQTHSYN